MAHPLRRLGASLALLSLVVGCTGAPEPVSEPVPASTPGAPDPATAVSELLAALAAQDYERASGLTVDDQMIAIAVTGNVPTEALQSVLDGGGADIGANYWQAFADNLQGFLGVTPAEVTVGEVTPIEVDGVQFAAVALSVPADRTSRRMVVQQTDGWKIDVVASFAPALAQRLGRSADMFRSDPSAADVLASLVRQRHSLGASLEADNVDPEVAQVIRNAIVSLGG
jgi:hypothetical protein